MKMILSSCDFSNPNSKQVILDNLDKKLCECKVLFIPNQKATYEKIHSDKYYDRLIECGFGKRENIISALFSGCNQTLAAAWVLLLELKLCKKATWGQKNHQND